MGIATRSARGAARRFGIAQRKDLVSGSCYSPSLDQTEEGIHRWQRIPIALPSCSVADPWLRPDLSRKPIPSSMRSPPAARATSSHAISRQVTDIGGQRHGRERSAPAATSLRVRRPQPADGYTMLMEPCSSQPTSLYSKLTGTPRIRADLEVTASPYLCCTRRSVKSTKELIASPETAGRAQFPSAGNGTPCTSPRVFNMWPLNTQLFGTMVGPRRPRLVSGRVQLF